MNKNLVIPLEKFMDGSYKDEPTPIQKVVIHFKKNKRVYIRVGLITTSICLSVLHPSLAATGVNVDIDKEGYAIYKELLGIGKWVIVVKGGWDVVRATLASDFEKAKKGFISYLLAYVFLLALPALMDKADGIVGHFTMKG